MSQALHTASTGINAGQSQINVIANNVANINTTAFKAANVTFETLYSNNLSYGSAATKDGGGTNPKQIGLGTKISGITRNFTPGTFVSTGRNLDMMISGTGFFVVQDAAGNNYFTRDGVFSTDSDGNLVTQSGMKVVAAETPYGSSGSGKTVQVPTNLKAVVSDTPSATLAAKTLAELNNVSISAGDFNLTYKKADGTVVGTVTLTVPDGDGTVGGMVSSFNSAITTYNEGKADEDKINVTASVVDGAVQFTPTTGSISFQALTTNFISETGLNDTNYTTNTLNQSVQLEDLINDNDANGISLISTTVDEHGIIRATYSDGSSLTSTLDSNDAIVWKYATPESVQITGSDVTATGRVLTNSNFVIEMATMVNQEGLVSLNNNLWDYGPDCGEVYYGMAGYKSFGAIESGGYEESNVDIANELSNMISAQRMIQMNSRVFSTASSIMETLAYLGQ